MSRQVSPQGPGQLDAEPFPGAYEGQDLASGKLSDAALASLSHSLSKWGEHLPEVDVDQAEAGVGASKGHGHGEKESSLLTAAASAVINFLLMFGLCCAYGIIMFEDEWNARHRGLGVKINLATAFIVGLVLACFSKVPVAIGGPDLNPVVFLGMLVQTISKEIGKKHGLGGVYPEGGNVCPGAPKPMFCQGGAFTSYDSIIPVDLADFSDAASYAAACDHYHEELRATAIFTVSATSAMLAVMLFLLGRLKLTRFLSFIPSNIMEAFLACIGYKVFKYALKFCKYEPKQFVPAACVGVPLYFIKAMHLGNPAVVIPLMLMIPLGIYYAVVFGVLQDDLEVMRKEKWMFDKLENADFWSLWEHGAYMSAGKIDFSAFATSLKDVPIMIVVVTLDCALKVFSTDAKLPVKTHKDYEVQLYGATNLLTTLCGSSVGYMQLKFNVINYGVLGNVVDRRGGIMYALMCGVCFFWTTDPFNYLPRFFLSTLLFFAGAGFIAENLWGSRKFLSVSEWLQVLLIIAVFIFTGSLLLAVVLGGLIAACSFVLTIAKVPAIHSFSTGSQVNSHMRQAPVDLMSIQHVSERRLLVVRLKGFLFFGCANRLADMISSWLQAQKENEEAYQHLRFLILDMTIVDGVESSAAKCLARVVKVADEHCVRVIWCMTQESSIARLRACGAISTKEVIFKDVEIALAHVERGIVAQIDRLRRLLLKLHPGFVVHRGLMSQQAAFEPFQDILTTDASRFGCPWKFCNRLEIKHLQTVLFKPRESGSLFLVHSGSVGLFTRASEAADEEWGRLVATYRRGWFLNRGALDQYEPSDYFAVALEDGEVVVWNQAQLQVMSTEQPAMATALREAVLKQERDDARLSRLSLSATLDDTLTIPRLPGLRRRPSSLHVGLYPRDVAEWLPGSLRSLKAGLATAKWLNELGLYSAAPTDNTLSALPQAGLATAKWLDGHGLDCVAPADNNPAALPPLPSVVLEALRIAFNTYSDPEGLLGSEDIEKALNYAGLYGYVLLPEAVQRSELSISEDDFLALGRQCAMAPFSVEQDMKLRQLFAAYVGSRDCSATMRRVHLMQLLNEKIGDGMCIDVVAGTASMWSGEPNSRIDVDAFVGIMSRLTKAHERYWFLLWGFEEFLKAHGKRASGDITPEMLAALSEDGASALGREAAEELTWIANFANPSSHDTIGLFALAAVMSTALFVKPQGLPPRPLLCGASAALQSPPASKPQPPNMASKPLADPGPRQAERPDAAPAVSLASGQSMYAAAEDCVMRLSAEAEIRHGFSQSIQIAGQKQAGERTRAQSLYLFLENPESGRAAGAFSLMMTLLILTSVLTLVIEPLIASGADMPDAEKNVWLALDGFFSVTFTVELFVRFAVCNAFGTKTHAQFLKSPLTITDIVAVLPWYIDLATAGDAGASELRLLRVARLMRLARLVRLGRLASRFALIAPVSAVLVVIWGIFLKNGVSSSC